MVVYDPSSYVPKNVTNNCSLLELIFGNFKTIGEYLKGLVEELERRMNEEGAEKMNKEELREMVKEELKKVDEGNVLWKVMGLKKFEECIDEEEF